MSRPRPARPITRALLDALAESAPGENVANIKRVVDSLVAKAIDGDLHAIREIFDRIDGKPPAAVPSMEGEEPRKVTFEWKSE
jgi:hypothetical protein